MIKSNSGFIIADFLFSFVLVISVGILIFALTFSLATIEVSQYIVWSSARNYSAGNIDDVPAQAQARAKFDNLSAQFPLLTGSGATSSWFTLTFDKIGNLGIVDTDFVAKVSASDIKNASGTESRQPWTGISAKLNLKLFSSLSIPFLGKVAADPTVFEFPIRAFIIRNPSIKECRDFFLKENRYDKGFKLIEKFNTVPDAGDAYAPQEDNGC